MRYKICCILKLTEDPTKHLGGPDRACGADVIVRLWQEGRQKANAPFLPGAVTVGEKFGDLYPTIVFEGEVEGLPREEVEELLREIAEGFEKSTYFIMEGVNAYPGEKLSITLDGDHVPRVVAQPTLQRMRFEVLWALPGNKARSAKYYAELVRKHLKTWRAKRGELLDLAVVGHDVRFAEGTVEFGMVALHGYTYPSTKEKVRALLEEFNALTAGARMTVPRDSVFINVGEDSLEKRRYAQLVTAA
ncbi:MAG: hypothetical protein HYS26_00875 [Candidatus Kaiserbacteria bacterium]|nr:MAG: hypothetical protein HYS26_00875 [Candidatus Kaiserbacteria bacterium]